MEVLSVVSTADSPIAKKIATLQKEVEAWENLKVLRRKWVNAFQDLKTFVDTFQYDPEWEELTKSNIEDPSQSQAAVQPENIMKNRYKNIVPCNEKKKNKKKTFSVFFLTKISSQDDGTRVRLSGVDDYINASYIRPIEKDGISFIGSQAPLAHTNEDFFRMILTEKAVAVVMLTKHVESGVVKADEYLPNTQEPKIVGKFSIRVEELNSQHQDFICKKVYLNRVNSKGFSFPFSDSALSFFRRN
jgi:protein tyrosine phosphatase